MIDFKCLELLNIISNSGIPITAQEAADLMRLAQRNNCRICQEKVKDMAKAAGLTIFGAET